MIKNIQEIIEQAEQFSVSKLLAKYLNEYKDIKNKQIKMLMDYYKNQGYVITGLEK